MEMVEVLWHGHACFEIRGKDGVIVIDPFKGIGISEPKAEADLVLCSHSHSDHCNVEPVKAASGESLIGFVGSRKIGKIEVQGVPSFHDDSQGSKRGKNTVHVFTLDGIRFCHMGDLGHELGSDLAGAIGSVDVLFVPVGGGFTIGPNMARDVVAKLKPSYAFPMHYRVAGMSANFNALSTVDDFLKIEKNIINVNGPSFSFDKTDLPKETHIIVLKM